MGSLAESCFYKQTTILQGCKERDRNYRVRSNNGNSKAQAASAPQMSVVEEAEPPPTTERDAEKNIVSDGQKQDEFMPTNPLVNF